MKTIESKGIDRRLLRRLPAFSPIAVRLLSVLADERTSFKDIARLIALDPVLAGEVLRLANSGLYGRRYEVRSVLQAIATLGMGILSQVAVTAALWRGLPRRTTPFVRDWWRHSIAAALVARQCGKDRAMEYAYTAALLHGVGQLALFEDAPQRYPTLVERAYVEGAGLLATERVEFGVDHKTLAGVLLDSWGLPEKLCHVVARHHESATDDPLAVAVRNGCAGAEFAGFGQCGCHEPVTPGVPGSLEELPGSEYLLGPLVAEINQIECYLA